MAEIIRTGNLIPREDGKGTLGLEARPWEKAYVTEIVSPVIDAINTSLGEKAAQTALEAIQAALADKADKTALAEVKAIADAAAAKSYVDQKIEDINISSPFEIDTDGNVMPKA